MSIKKTGVILVLTVLLVAAIVVAESLIEVYGSGDNECVTVYSSWETVPDGKEYTMNLWKSSANGTTSQAWLQKSGGGTYAYLHLEDTNTHTSESGIELSSGTYRIKLEIDAKSCYTYASANLEP